MRKAGYPVLLNIVYRYVLCCPAATRPLEKRPFAAIDKIPIYRHYIAYSGVIVFQV